MSEIPAPISRAEAEQLVMCAMELVALLPAVVREGAAFLATRDPHDAQRLSRALTYLAGEVVEVAAQAERLATRERGSDETTGE